MMDNPGGLVHRVKVMMTVMVHRGVNRRRSSSSTGGMIGGHRSRVRAVCDGREGNCENDSAQDTRDA